MTTASYFDSLSAIGALQPSTVAAASMAPSIAPPAMASPGTFSMTPATTGGLGWADGMADRMGAWGQGTLPDVAGGGGWASGMGKWFSNGQNLGAVFQGISALTNAYLGFQQLGVAKDSLRFQKDAFQTNLRNSTQSYNTQLEDRIRGRTSDYAGKEADVQAYLDKNRLGG